MEKEVSDLVLSIRVLEGKLTDKRRRLEDIRKNCNHISEIQNAKDGETGEILFEDKVCKICGVLLEKIV